MSLAMSFDHLRAKASPARTGTTASSNELWSMVRRALAAGGCTLATAVARRHSRERPSETHVIVGACFRCRMALRTEQLWMPSKGVGQEQRLTFRVAVRPDAGVDAYLKLAGRRLPATVGDVSAEGIFITLARGVLPALKVDSIVDVEISFEGDRILLCGIVRSQRAGGYGIYFPERDPAGRANPLGRFARISAQLQRSSLSQRLRVLDLRDR
jgi:hypothetical protein